MKRTKQKEIEYELGGIVLFSFVVLYATFRLRMTNNFECLAFYIHGRRSLPLRTEGGVEPLVSRQR